MSSENEDQLPPDSISESKHVVQKQSKISYTRDFLLSFSSLDICKKLPSGVDLSVLSELLDDSSSEFERQRSQGGSLLQGSRRSDYGSPPSNRSEGSSTYSRGSGGRWDTYSSGSSDKDGDLQPDRESSTQDSGRRLGNQTRRWQHTEHDGLLGSGSYPRPPAGYAGASALKSRGSHYQINKSTEPYQPPRPYKAVPYSRKDGTDSCNDETFGSTECSSEDRADLERKRRESFDLMRKEQHKALQEKKKQIPDNQIEIQDTDIIALLGNSEDAKNIRSRNIMPDDPVSQSLSKNDPSRISCHTQAPASRPLVPPGFASALTEKNICMQSSSTYLAPEVGSASIKNSLPLNGMHDDQESRNHSVASMDISTHNNDIKSTSVQSVDANEIIMIPSSGVEIPMHSVGFEIASFEKLGLSDANEVWKDVVNDLFNKKEASSEDIYTVNHNQSTSILEKLFGSALSKDCSSTSSSVEYQGVKTEEEEWNPALSESSKFARWFREDEKKPVEDSSRDLLSLIISNDKAGSPSIISSDKGIEHNKDPVPELQLTTTSSTLGISEKYYAAEKLVSSSGVLTCEDLEQSILAEVKENSSTLQHSVQGPWSDARPRDQKADVDDHASQHILSLLQKGSSDKLGNSDVKGSLGVGVTDSFTVRNSEVIDSSVKSQTLEALFGAAFMNELHSAEAPLSVKRGLAGETINTDASIQEGNFSALHQNQEAKAHNTAGSWVRYGDTTTGAPRLGDVGFEEGSAAVIQLPEEDSLITIGDSLDPIISDSLPFENANQMNLGGGPLLYGRHDMVDSENLYNHLHGRQSLQFPRHMNQTRPSFPQLDHQQMKFIGPNSINHDPPNRFPTNFIPQHTFNNTGRPQFDPAAHHPMLQHMPFPLNFPLHPSMQGLPRGVPLSRPINHMPGYIPDMNNVQHSFPPLNRQPNFGGLEMGRMPGGGGPHPEVLERLIQMEMRANSKQIHPTAGGHIPGFFGPDFDMNFRYR